MADDRLLVLPVKALLMNLLTTAATAGILVLIFQDGNLTGPLGFTSPQGIEQTDFLVLVAIVFGLSTDYGVFLLARIKEAHDGGLANADAVAVGLQRTGAIVTAAAILLAVALGAFVTSQLVFLKELGVGAAFAVLIDAFIVRALLVPALMGTARQRQLVVPPPTSPPAPAVERNRTEPGREGFLAALNTPPWPHCLYPPQP